MHAFVDDRHLVEQRPAQLLGLQHASASSRPEHALLGDRATLQRVQDDGEDAARGRHRGDPRRRLQPHRRRQPARARRCRSAASTTPPTTGCRRTTRATTWTSPAAATRSNMQHPRVLQLIMDSLRYWVAGDARRRLPLRPRLRAGARAATTFDYGSARSSTRSRQDPVLSQVKLIAEPWDLGEGGYQVGNFPPGWIEWNGQYRDTVRALLEGRRRPDRRARDAAVTGSADLYERSGRRPARQHQLRHRARRLHAARPRQLQRQAQRGQRRGQPRRQQRQPSAGTAAPRGRPTTRRSWPCARGRSATCSRRCCCRRACRCCWPATSSAARQQRQQQRLLPGQRDLLARLGRGRPPTLIDVRQAADRAAPRASGASPAALLPRPPDPRHRRQGHRLAQPGRPRADPTRTGTSRKPARLGFLLGGDAGELFYSTGGRQELDDGFVVLFNAFHEPVPFILPATRRARAGRW